MASKVWVISELYYPEESATGFYMTGLAEGFAAYWNVNALCSQPTYGSRGTTAPWREEHNGVVIERCRATRLGKDLLFFRLINLATISLSIFLKCLVQIKSHDVVLVVTNPPLLPYVVVIACWLRRAKCILRIDDVYPETMIATGMIKVHGAAAVILSFLNEWLYRRVDGIIVLGRDMAQLVRKKLQGLMKPIVAIPNWADVDQIVPEAKQSNRLLRELGLTDKFVVQCAGNMGRAQGVEALFAAAELLKDDESIHFLFIGSGKKTKWMEETAKKKRLQNVTLLKQRPRSDQANFLNACDAAIVTLLPGTTGVAVPSRAYNCMAVGKPIIAMVERDSEVALIVQEEKIGWVVPPNAYDKLVEAIIKACSNPELMSQMGKRARAIAESKYCRSHVIGCYVDFIKSEFKFPESDPQVSL